MTDVSDAPVAVVTGGSLGIGAHIVEQLLGLGWAVHVIARRASSVALADHQRSHAHDVDIRDPSAVSAVRDRVAAVLAGRRLAGLVICAGVGYPTPLVDVTPEQYAELFETNVAGAIFATRAFSPMLDEGRAVIAFMSSIAGRRGFADWSVYCASKHALEGFAASVRDELRPRGIRVTSIQPGSVDTPSYDHLAPEEKVDFIDPSSVAALTVQALLLPPQAVVETLFVNNAVGDL